MDTMFFLKKDTLVAYPEAQALNGIKYETVSIFCRHSDSNMPRGKHRYLDNYFFEVKKAKDSRAELTIGLSAKNATFYRLNPIKVDSLNRESTITLETIYGRYDDVQVVKSEDYMGTLYDRSNFVTKVYWSKSQGLVRYDKKGDVYWELVDVLKDAAIENR